MDSEKVRALISAIETGSFSKTADILGYTTSGISRMVASLEEETGFSLLIRSKSGVVPTRECKTLLPTAYTILQDVENYKQIASEILGISRGTIVIGTAYYAYYGLLTDIAKEFRKDYPNIEIRIIEGNSSELIRAVEERRADICIVSKRPGDFVWYPLKQDPLLALVPKEHPMAEKSKFPIRAFEEVDFIELYPGQETDNKLMFKKNGIKPNIRFATVDNYAAYEMVKSGLGVTCTNKLIADSFSKGVATLPLDPTYLVEIGIAVNNSGAAPAAEKFIRYAILKMEK